MTAKNLRGSDRLAWVAYESNDMAAAGMVVVGGMAEAATAGMAVEAAGAAFVIDAEDAGEGALPGDDGAVEDAVGAGDEVARDDGILAVAPDGVGAAFGAILPGNVGDGLGGEFEFFGLGHEGDSMNNC